jgi:dTDP-4-dehydrorhamnose 3,5-epimerase
MTEPRAIDIPLHLDARGWLLATDQAFAGMPIAYAYATCCWPGVVKGWHRHLEHEDRLLCVAGTARIVAARRDPTRRLSITDPTQGTFLFQEFIAGPLAPRLIVIPAGWWHAFTPVGSEPCVILNAPDMAYDPEDEERLPLEAIPFEWKEVSG